MIIVRSNTIRLAVAVVIICGFCLAQDQGSADPHTGFERLCSFDQMFTPYEVGSDFSVSLSFRQAPLPGIRVVLTPGESAVASGHSRVPIGALTDPSGAAHFLAVPAGKYHAGAKNGLFFPSNEITVLTDGDFDNEVEIEWPPDLSELSVRKLRGILVVHSEAAGASRPLSQATVKLLDLRSSRVIETTRTRADGSYQFSTTEPGLYAVRVFPPSKDNKTEPVSGDLAVELGPIARGPVIPEVEVQQSECAGVQLLQRTGKD